MRYKFEHSGWTDIPSPGPIEGYKLFGLTIDPRKPASSNQLAWPLAGSVLDPARSRKEDGRRELHAELAGRGMKDNQNEAG